MHSSRADLQNWGELQTCNKLSKGQCHSKGCSSAFWMQVHNFLQTFCSIFPSFAHRNNCGGITSREKKTPSEISLREENFQKEPVGSSQSYSISLHLLLQQRICPQDSLSHELHALLIADTLIMLGALTASVILPARFALQVFQSLYGNKRCIHYKASALPLCCTSSGQSQLEFPLL